MIEQVNDPNKWIERVEKLYSRQADQIDMLTRDVSALTADVRSLMKHQEVLAAKTSRPFQWGAFIAAVSLVAVGAGLLINPISSEQERQHLFDVNSMQHREESAYTHGYNDCQIEWLNKLEDRVNNRIHGALK